MTSPSTDRRFGMNASIAVKAPCRVATTANITLSGSQSIDGVTTATDDRVLVKDQTDTTENGIYTADTGDWTRTTDFDGTYDATGGTLVIVNQGSTNSHTSWMVSADGAVEIGTDAITFTAVIPPSVFASSSALVSFANAGVGAVTRTLQAADRAITRSADYSSTANFNTATAALTESIGVNKLLIGATAASADAGGLCVRGAPATLTTGMYGQSLSIVVNHRFEPAASGSTLNQFGSAFQITGGSGNQTISRVALYAGAQTGGGGTNQVMPLNLVVIQNSADAATSIAGAEIDVNNNKADDVLNPAASVSHYALSIVSGGSKKIGPAAINISSSLGATNAWRRGLYVAISSLTTDGFLIDYAGPGTGGVFQVDASGRVAVGTTINASAALAIGQVGTILTGTSQYSVFEASVASSAATVQFASFSSQPATVAAAFICPLVTNYKALDATKGAGSTITTQIGFDVSDLTMGTNNYGFRGQVSAGANKFNLNMTGTADNFLEGKVKFGATGIAANAAQTVTVGNVGPGAAGVSIQEWVSVKNASGTTRYIPLFG